MAINLYRIEAFFDAHKLAYFRNTEDADSPAWVLFFGTKAGVIVRLLEHGEFLLMRTLPMVYLDECTRDNRLNVAEYLLKRNDQLILGHYCGGDEVVFEAGLPIENGEVTDEQIGRMLWTISMEAKDFGPKIRALSRGEQVVDDKEESINELMRRLFESDTEENDEN